MIEVVGTTKILEREEILIWARIEIEIKTENVDSKMCIRATHTLKRNNLIHFIINKTRIMMGL